MRINIDDMLNGPIDPLRQTASINYEHTMMNPY